ncbi:MAG: cell division protein SepF [Clostridia bacterium]|nr:cell division protein SepF [Clostridia bacterium]
MKKESSSLEVVVFSPDRFSDETRKIADELVKEEHTVVLSLENCDKDNSRRIIDFMSGAAYATGGKIKRAAATTFVVIPHSVKLTGDELLAQLEESGVL